MSFEGRDTTARWLDHVPRTPDMGQSAPVPEPLRVAVVVASVGRPDVVGDVLADIARQTTPADWVVLSVPDRDSLPPGGPPAGIVVVHASGAAAQRNAGLAAVPHADVAVFFDDDARVREDYFAEMTAVFEQHDDVIGLTGRVLLDGAAGEAISPELAAKALAISTSEPVGVDRKHLEDRSTLYGCNFAYRVGASTQRFDERLPLYSWLEDHDLARRLLPEGRLVTASNCVIVHRGVKSGGRVRHGRLGYSQVMNPAYFVRKGSFPWALALKEAARPVIKNFVCSFLPRASAAWRRERLRGNVMATWDILRGRLTPERILEL